MKPYKLFECDDECDGCRFQGFCQTLIRSAHPCRPPCDAAFPADEQSNVLQNIEPRLFPIVAPLPDDRETLNRLVSGDTSLPVEDENPLYDDDMEDS